MQTGPVEGGQIALPNCSISRRERGNSQRDLIVRGELPPWAARIVDHPPVSGEGFHRWLFRAALALFRCQWPAGDVRAILENAACGCGRLVPASEIDKAVASATLVAAQRGRGSIKPLSKWPSVCRARINQSGAQWGLADLWELSPVRIEEENPSVEEFIDWLFPGNPLLCIGRSSCNFKTKSRDEWRGKLSHCQLIVPSPMSAPTGRTKAGRTSERSLENTGVRRFLVVEFDQGAVDQQASLLLHLSDFAPLALVVHSGGKSLHGWFVCCGESEDKIRPFMEYAVHLGADPATWTRSQLVRLPGGLRDNGHRQRVFFFNPQSLTNKHKE